MKLKIPAVKKDVAIVSACFVLLWIVLSTRIVGSQRDFFNFYRGAALAVEGRFVESHVLPDALIIFVRPPSYALLLAPLALLPAGVALWLWMSFQTLLLGVCIWWACRRFGSDALLFGAMYAPAALAIPHGQDAPLLLAILTAAYALAEKQRPGAGAILGLGFIKFHLFLLWPLLLLAARRFRMLAWFCASIGVQIAVCLLISGPQGLRSYAALLQRTDLVHLLPSVEKNVNLAGILANLNISSRTVYAIAALTVIGCATVASLRAPLWKVFAVATAGSLLLAPHVYAYDATMLLLPAWCAIYLSTNRFTRTSAAVLCMPVLVLAGILGPPLSGAPGLAVCVFFIACVFSVEQPKSYRAAPSLPTPVTQGRSHG